MDAPGSFSRLITLQTMGAAPRNVTGLIALGAGYALAALHTPEGISA
jgi:hypothetical protein